MNKAIIEKYFTDLSDKQKAQFDQLGDLYKDWNTKINVISRKDIDELYINHVLHCLSIAKFKSFQLGEKVMDLGSGGGFPGIPLAILFPETEFTLVDSIGKKIKVVNAIAADINLQNVEGIHERAEKIKKSFDYVVTRAVAPARQLWNWSHALIKKGNDNGIICLKGGNLEEELKELKRPHQVVEINDYFEESNFETKKIVYIPR